MSKIPSPQLPHISPSSNSSNNPSILNIIKSNTPYFHQMNPSSHQNRLGMQARIFSTQMNPISNSITNQNLNLRINRVTSKQYKQRQSNKLQFSPHTHQHHHLVNSLYTKSNDLNYYNPLSQKMITSTSTAQKNYPITETHFQQIKDISHQLPTHANKPLHLTFNQNNQNNQNNNNNNNNNNIHLEVHSPRYAHNKDSQNCSVQNQVAEYNPMSNLISSVISREERRKISDYQQKYMSASSKYKDQQNFDQHYAYSSSKFPIDSNGKLGMQVSKAISSHAIKYQLQKQYQNQNRTIQKLSTQVQSLKVSQHKWGDTKNKYQLDLQAKIRQIFDLQRANKRLTQQVKSLKSYRTTQTVQQVIIARLKQQIIILNKKNIQKQANYYKYQNLQKSKILKDNNNILIQIHQKQISLLNQQLKIQKQKSWKLQKFIHQSKIQKQLTKEDHDRQINNAKTDINILNQEVIKHINTIRMKQASIAQMKRSHESQIKKLSEKANLTAEQLSKIKHDLTQQIQARQRLLIQKKSDQQYNKKLQQFKANYQKQQHQLLKIKQKYYLQQLQQQKKYYLNQIQLIKSIQLQQQKQNKLEQQQNYYESLISKQIQKKNSQLKQQQTLFNRSLKDQQSYYNYKLQQQIKTHNNELSSKLYQKQQQLKIKLSQQHQKQQIKLLDYGKQQTEKMTKYQNQLSNLKAINQQNSILIKQLIKQNQHIKDNLKHKCNQIQTIKLDMINKIQTNKKQTEIQKQKWSQNQSLKIQTKLKNILQLQVKQKQKQLSAKINDLSLRQQQHEQKTIALQTKQYQIKQKIKNKQQQYQVKKKQFLSQYQELLNKYNAITPQFNSLKSQKSKLQQKLQQNAIQLKRTFDTINVWKMKAQTVTSVQKERDQLKILVKQLEEGKGVKSQLNTRIEQLTSQQQILLKKLSQKQDQLQKRQSSYIKIRGYYDSDQVKNGALGKQIRALQSKIAQVQAKLKAVLTKVALQQFKYKQLYEKVAGDAQTYMAYIQKLQQQGQMNYQKYLKLWKICRTSKVQIIDQNQEVQRVDSTIYQQYIKKQILNQFTKMIIPSMQCRISEKLAETEQNLIKRAGKINVIRSMALKIKKQRNKQLLNSMQ